MVKEAAYLLAGEETFLKEEELRRIESAVLDEMTRDFYYDIFYGQEAAGRDIVDRAHTLAFMGKKRLVVVKDVDRLCPYDQELIITYLSNPSRFTCLVLETDKTELKGTFFTAVSKHAHVLLFRPLKEKELTRWILYRVKLNNKSIATSATELLRENVGGDLRTLAGAIDNLVSYIGERKEITKGDVENMVGKSITHTTFELVDAIGQKRTSDALGILRSLLKEGQRAPQILGALLWHYRRIRKAKESLTSGKSKGRVSRELRVGSYFSNGFFAMVDGLSMGELERDFQILLETDVDIKTGRRKPELALEMLVVNLH